MTEPFGTLYIVATPIGNLGDITARALEILRSVDLIAAEDTRHSKLLLQHFGIETALLSLYEHNERQRTPAMLDRLKQGENIALISDAGTPLISDPGYILVSQARAEGITVLPIPGASAITAALSAAGLPTDRFLFAGFVPARTEARKQVLTELAKNSCTVILFESCHRIVNLLQDLEEILEPGRTIVIAREMTKRFETFLTGDAQGLLEILQNDSDQQRGEFVILIQGQAVTGGAQSDELRRTLEILLEELPVKQAANLAARLTGQKRNAAYTLALQLKTDQMEK